MENQRNTKKNKKKENKKYPYKKGGRKRCHTISDNLEGYPYKKIKVSEEKS